jgi:Mu transposase-like protein
MQVRKLMREMNKENNIGKASLKAGMNRKTGRKYYKSGKLPSELKKPHTWRTRKDPFETDWVMIEELITHAPELEAKTIMYMLSEKFPGRYQEGQVRTLQRRIRDWKATNGPDKAVFFTQEHVLGEAMQLDFTDCNKLDITINGEDFNFKLNHIVLPYSNWEWATICFSESFEALKKGIKATLICLGFTSKWLQTDNSSAATHKISKIAAQREEKNESPRHIPKGREFNHAYESLVLSLGMTPRTTGVGKKEQNGDVEVSHSKLKSRIKQYLIVRGSKDFNSKKELEEFLHEIMRRANHGREKRFLEEMKYLNRLHSVNIVERTEIATKVRSSSTIIVKHHIYSVPSRLIGEKVMVYVYEDRIEVYYKAKLQLRAERIHKENLHNLNYRHLVRPMLRKPGALARFKYISYMFPNLTFRKAYDALLECNTERKAAINYLRILNLCIDVMESEVEAALEITLEEGVVPYFEEIQSMISPLEIELPKMECLVPDLAVYDNLLPDSSGKFVKMGGQVE